MDAVEATVLMSLVHLVVYPVPIPVGDPTPNYAVMDPHPHPQPSAWSGLELSPWP